MSAVRSIWLLGVPSIVIAAGIYLFRKRSLTFTDPGGSKEPEIEERIFSDNKVDINTAAEKTIDLIITPDPIDNTIKSAPINIPVGSPIQLTDDQIDIEVQKIQSQKSQEKEYTMSSSVILSSGYIPCSETQHTYLVDKSIKDELEITANNEVQSIEASPIVEHKFNESNSLKESELSELPTELPNRLEISPKLQESIEVTLKIDNSNNALDPNFDALLENSDGSNDDLNSLKNSDASNDNLNSLEDDSTKELVDVTPTESGNGSEIVESISDSLNLKVDWSSDVTDLDFGELNTHKSESRPADSAYHSPTQNMRISPQLSNCSDDQPGMNWNAQARSDSGSEHCSDSGTESASSIQVFYFTLPKDLVGRLIGSGGKFVKSIKTKSGAKVLARGDYSNCDDLELCSVEGKDVAIKNALSLIRNHFPKKRFPDVTLEKVHLEEPTIILEPEFYTVELPHRVIQRCTISSVVDGGRGLFCLQIYNRSSLTWLESMKQSMTKKWYNEIGIAPRLPKPIIPGNICVCQVKNEWHRASVLKMESKEIALVRLLDIGQRLLIHKNELYQIRTEFMQLPFQAIDCYLANTKLPDGANEWPAEATEILRVAIAQNKLYFSVERRTEDGVSLINLYSRQTGKIFTHFNEEFVSRGFLEREESNC